MLLPVAKIELIYIDASNNTSAVVVNVPISSSVETLDATALALASLVAPMTSAVLIKIRYVYQSKLEADTIDAGSTPIVVNGMFFLSPDDDSPMEVLSIPSFKPELLVHIGPTSEYGVDTTSDEVIALLLGLIDVNASNPFGDMVLNIAAAYLQRRV